MVYYLKDVYNKNEILFVACVYVCAYCGEDYDRPMGVESAMAYVPVLYLYFARAS